MKFLVKFHSTFSILKFRLGIFGHIFSFFFFVKMKSTRETRFWLSWRFFSGAHFVFHKCIWLLLRPLFFQGHFFHLFHGLKFWFHRWRFCFFPIHSCTLMGSFFLIFHRHGFGFHKWNFAIIFTGIFSFSRLFWMDFHTFSRRLFFFFTVTFSNFFHVFDFLFSRGTKHYIFHKIQYLLWLSSLIIGSGFPILHAIQKSLNP